MLEAEDLLKQFQSKLMDAGYQDKTLKNLQKRKNKFEIANEKVKKQIKIEKIAVELPPIEWALILTDICNIKS